ncbi:MULTISPECIES: hypothetical protein [unclassified Saccharopolyspora]|uniref:hypothetical protein n=1 Tax=unclassified Saccharopolyspora TaxID=2646250 RepID=UPI001CD4A1BC|nr:MULTISPECIES: hypothetical protein [unclassified Saccharopolyspora]MCA1185788.1 hypothetical protein [Saccharopolyspora sp. 6T]MCA1191700.1 hypothetical protein [Saccharopolyspora sp. 6V]
MTTGEQLQLAGVESNLAAATAPHRDFLWHAERALAELIHEGTEFTAEDVRRRIPEGVEPHDPNVLPSLMSRAAKAKRMTHVGTRPAERKSRHAGRIGRWIGCPGRSQS